eukprot:364688-Chlamydomonas_euryale.AAC.5
MSVWYSSPLGMLHICAARGCVGRGERGGGDGVVQLGGSEGELMLEALHRVGEGKEKKLASVGSPTLPPQASGKPFSLRRLLMPTSGTYISKYRDLYIETQGPLY